MITEKGFHVLQTIKQLKFAILTMILAALIIAVSVLCLNINKRTGLHG